MTEHPPCEYCGKPMFQRKGEDIWHFRRRKCCNRKCSNLLMARRGREHPIAIAGRIAIAAMRACVVCKGPMTHRAFERVGNFENRQTCSPECTTQYRGIQATAAVRAKAVAPRQTKPIDYGKGFGVHTIDPGDGGTLRAVRPDDGLSLSVAGRYL